jgi:hypothetical protein
VGGVVGATELVDGVVGATELLLVVAIDHERGVHVAIARSGSSTPLQSRVQTSDI